jgi:tripartite-type tricarboxylate transporter receptor subunit TctC
MSGSSAADDGDRAGTRLPTTHMRRRLLLALAGCGLARRRLAQTTWPSRPITLVVPFGPGGIADLTARTVAQAMQRSLGTPIVVDNRPSAGSVVASTAVAKARPTATRCC